MNYKRKDLKINKAVGKKNIFVEVEGSSAGFILSFNNLDKLKKWLKRNVEDYKEIYKEVISNLKTERGV